MPVWKVMRANYGSLFWMRRDDRDGKGRALKRKMKRGGKKSEGVADMKI